MEGKQGIVSPESFSCSPPRHPRLALKVLKAKPPAKPKATAAKAKASPKADPKAKAFASQPFRKRGSEGDGTPPPPKKGKATK